MSSGLNPCVAGTAARAGVRRRRTSGSASVLGIAAEGRGGGGGGGAKVDAFCWTGTGGEGGGGGGAGRVGGWITAGVTAAEDEGKEANRGMSFFWIFCIFWRS